MGSRTKGNLGGSGYGASRQDWAAHKFQPKKLLENGAFITKHSIDVYLSGDFITCLECGQECRSLGHHLGRTHAMSSSEYKVKYNIPKGRSLRGESSRKLSAIGAMAQWIDADERREKMRQHAYDRLVGVGTFAPRTTKHKRPLFTKTCLTCKKEFKVNSTTQRKKYCNRKCLEANEAWLDKLKENGKLGGATRKNGKKDSTGKFV